ncbi:hypothetical protein BZG36_04254 [Bifiguratus adelaidae]|uniref:SCP2 domain-containing protein n=1 Tax=Bifiguratus adelaidae TaxID=1938954 RepID=A0A261XVX7_9FUNG|nr:hypothetical protein BZG36_04254 [Bifiguratus adelaidae]
MASTDKPLLADSLFPELKRQLTEDPSLRPNVKALFIVNVLRKKQKAATWYLAINGKANEPHITKHESELTDTERHLKKIRIEVEDADFFNFITGGLTGFRAYMTGKLKVKGDLMLAQKLEEFFRKMGGVERAMEFINKDPALQAQREQQKAIKAKL